MQLEEFGPFLLVRPLGKGGMGVVYLAKPPAEVPTLAAVKRLRPDVATVQGFAERFWHEAELAKRLHHPNIVETLDVGEVDGKPYVASSFILGKSVAAICDRLAELRLGASIAVVSRIVLECLSALAYIHEARDASGRRLELIHRDITPGNILLGYDGKTRLADFGLAKSFLSEKLMLTGEGMILGTPRYLPLEIVRGERATRGADIYGLGAVAYRLLTGTAPYEGDVRVVIEAILRGPPAKIRELRPDVPEWMSTFVERMMQRDLSQRPADAEALGKLLDKQVRAHHAIVSQEQVGTWLRELFRSEAPVEIAEAEDLQQSRRPPAPAKVENTRVLNSASSSHEESEAQATMLGGASGFGMEIPTDVRSVPELPMRMPATTSLEPRTLTPVDVDPTRKPELVLETGARPPSQRTNFLVAAIVALSTTLGILVGTQLVSKEPTFVPPTSPAQPPPGLIDRIDLAKKELARKKREGLPVAESTERLSREVSDLARVGNWSLAKVLVGDLEGELELVPPSGTSTAP